MQAACDDALRLPPKHQMTANNLNASSAVGNSRWPRSGRHASATRVLEEPRGASHAHTAVPTHRLVAFRCQSRVGVAPHPFRLGRKRGAEVAVLPAKALVEFCQPGVATVQG